MATTYYVSPTGNDANDGLTTATPWQTIAHINTVALLPGDEILFEGGTTFASTVGLNFTVGRCGTAADPIIISSYGTGRATLNVVNDHAFYAYECAGFEITDLNFVGAGRTVNSFAGIFFYSDTPVPIFTVPNRYEHVVISRVEVSGFNRGGIKFQGTEEYTNSGNTQASSGWESVDITFAVVHDNGDFGIELIGDWLVGSTEYPLKDVLIQNCVAYDNPGQFGLTTEHTGNGIVVGNTENVLIDLCVAYNNGAENFANNGGPVGIWLWDSKDGVIQNSESYENKTNSTKDGGGFDLDGGCINCVIQYCYSHDNDGAGYLFAQFGGSRDMINNTARYNISQNDGRKNDYGAIQLWRDAFTAGTGVMDETYVYNNVVYISAQAGALPAAVRSISGNITNARIANNVFIVADGVPMVDKQFGSDIVLAGNAYYSLNGVYTYNEAGAVYNSLAAYRASGQEMVGPTPVGLEIDPQLVSAGNGGIVGNPTALPSLNEYQMQAGSPLEDAGLDLQALIGVNVGTRDFFGNATPVNAVHDIGAYEGAGATLSAGDIDFLGERLKTGIVFLRYDLGLEEKPDRLLLERSLDGENFEFVSQPALKDRIGDIYDYAAPSGKVFYRLGLVDLDGKVDYTRILEILPFEDQESLLVFPNPIREEISLILRSAHSYESAALELLDINGKIVFQAEANLTKDRIKLPLTENLSNGVYSLKLTTARSVLLQQVLIER
ncbi:MAG: right-handed parallel beta-helix repeat-containing protein [Bacteroidota bacterium]